MGKQQKNQKGNNKIFSTNNGYDIGKLRARRFVAMIIDWYIASMIAAIILIKKLIFLPLIFS